jgi:WhiB family redox-sensing transcriptional regulator
MVKGWRSKAACRGMDGDLFFPEGGPPSDLVKLACDSCPVKADCLEEAIETRELRGIWAGTTGRERQRIWRRRDKERGNVA